MSPNNLILVTGMRLETLAKKRKILGSIFNPNKVFPNSEMVEAQEEQI